MPSLPVRHFDDRPARAYRQVLPIILAFLLPVAVSAQGNGRSTQGTGGNHLIQGFVFFPSGRRAEGVIHVKLESYNYGELSVLADNSGQFTFSNLAPGNYTVVVIASDDYEISREGVFIDSDVNLSRTGLPMMKTSRRYTVMVTLQLKKDAANHTKGSVVNATLAEVPENARQQYEKALELVKAGDSLKAIDSLRAAISLFPNFPLALNELGVQYLKLGQPINAVDPLKSAVKLSPNAFTPELNLGIALLETLKFAEAETHLREALKRNDSAPTAHMYLGIVLVRLKRHEEAQKELELAITRGGDNFALVHKYLGGLYMNAGRNKEAADELEKYLKLDPKASNAERIRGTIKELRSKS
jgi:tetratricopeptide (TPR) repeat protein